MQDKYENKYENDTLTITIPSGPAAGTRVKDFPQIDEAGLIFIGHRDLPNGKFQPIKLRASEHPILSEAIKAAAAIRLAKAQAEYEAGTAERAVDAKMAEAGFEAAGNAGALWNRLHPINGANF